MVNNSPPQVTTDVRCVLAVVEYLKERIDAELVVAEGSGEGSTLENFKLIEGAALVSVAPAKDHTITRVTLGLKNMVGCLPASHYSGFWSYKKSQVHAVDTDQAVADLMLYIRPHLTIIDAIEGLAGGHLSGRAPDPPIGKILAGTNVLAADREAARLLGHDPEGIRHLTLAKQFQ
jgi:uncharacterized protein (DUF362 family)